MIKYTYAKLKNSHHKPDKVMLFRAVTPFALHMVPQME